MGPIRISTKWTRRYTTRFVKSSWIFWSTPSRSSPSSLIRDFRLSRNKRGKWGCSGILWLVVAQWGLFGSSMITSSRYSPVGTKENSEFYTIMLEYWTINSIPFIDQTLADKEDYDRQLRQAFEDKADETLEDAP